MTNDELERIMNFIIERQERTAEQQAANAEQLAQSDVLINALIERQERVSEQQAANAEQLAQSESLINALARRQLEMGEKLDDHDERIARFERSYTAISNLLQAHDKQIVTLTDGHNMLIERQERITEQQVISAEQLAQSEAIINALAKRQLEMGEQLGDHRTQMNTLTEGLNNLVRTVDRYITARGNGGGEA